MTDKSSGAGAGAPPSQRGGEVVYTAKRFRVVRVPEPPGAFPEASQRTRDVIEHPGSVVIVPLA